MANKGGPARSCEMCLGWSVMRWTRICSGCKAWKRKYRERGVCPRCQHEAHLNTDGLCKPCLQAIRAEDDAEWALRLPGARPRDLQLHVGTYRDYSTRAGQLIRSTGAGRRVNEEWRRKLKQQRELLDEPPTVLEPGTWGQIPLFTLPRTLTDTTIRAIADRSVTGWERARPVVAEMAAEHGLSAGWYYKVAEMVRLALAVREAEGAELLPEPALRDLPTTGDAIRLVLLRVGLLAPASAPMRFSQTDQPSRTPYITAPAPIPPPAPRQCRNCLAWLPGGHRGFRCKPCRHWRSKRTRGQCRRCDRGNLPLRDGLCRGCHPYRLLDEARPATARATQLLIDLPIGVGGPARPFPVDEPRVEDDHEAPAWRTGRGQEPLFTLRRDWSPVLARLRRRPPDELPLTEAARHLVEQFAQLRRDGQSPDYRKNTRTLTTLVYWLGAETAILERDIHDLAQLDPNLAAKPVCQFLRIRGLLVEDPELHRDVDQAWIETTLAALPEPIATEVRTWVAVLRGQGRRQGEARGYDGIRRYLVALQPTLAAWTAANLTTLREISQDQVEKAVDGLSGHARRQLAICLRSLFRALRQERVIFRDPTRHLPVGDLKGVPQSVPRDMLAGLLDQVTTPLGRLAIALVAVHAVPGNDM